MRKTLMTLFIITMLAVPFTAFAQEDGETLIIMTSDDATTWNWLLGSESGSSSANTYLYVGLTAMDPFTGEIIPSVAKNWETSEDGRTYTVYMRDDVTWSDGEVIDAYDVKFTFDALRSDVVGSPYASQYDIESVEVIDDFTVQMTFPDANCEATGQLGFGILPFHVFVPSQDFADIDWEAFINHPFNLSPTVSAGEYMFAEWVPDDYMKYTPNSNFVPLYPNVQTPANIENLYRRVIVDTNAQHQAFRAEEVDYGSVGIEGLNALKDEPFLNFAEYNNKTTTYFFLFNNADPTNPQPAYDEAGDPIAQDPHPILGDVRVRKALVMGWDHDAGIDAALEGHGSRVSTPIPPSMGWAYNSELEPYPFDVEGAIALLEEAGWMMNEETGIREKDGAPLSFEFLLAQGGGQWEILALLAQDQWRQNLGVDMEIKTMEWGAMVGQLMTQDFDATIIGFGGGDPQPDGIVRSLFLSENDIPDVAFNLGSYVNPELDTLLDEGLFMPGCKTEDRQPVYYKIQEILYEDVPFDFIYINTTILAIHEKVTGWDPDAAWGLLYNVANWEIQAPQ
ncbi:MAG: hypothetical protein JXB47_03780 [Anaerolineae bacterium]|nr:hypothetical protein [Anaerolineae bacterium]